MRASNVALGLLVLSLGASCVDREGQPIAERSQSILSGSDARARTGVVFVDHVDGHEVCSGALIGREVVLTARHCVVAGGSALPFAGFRIGVGANSALLDVRGAKELSLPEGADTNGASFRADGTDIAALILREPVSDEVEVYPPDLAYEPASTDNLTLVGFGLVGLDAGAAGARLEGLVHPVGWDRSSGVVEVAGAQACLGDSGGPALTQDRKWVGLVAEVGVVDGGACRGGRTFLTTARNSRVRAWLQGLLPEKDAGRPNSTDGGPARTVDAAREPVDSGARSLPGAAGGGFQMRHSSGCTALPLQSSGGYAGWEILFLCAAIRRGYRRVH